MGHYYFPIVLSNIYQLLNFATLGIEIVWENVWSNNTSPPPAQPVKPQKSRFCDQIANTSDWGLAVNEWNHRKVAS